MTVEWEGQERPLPQLQPYLKSPDRAVRERAFRAAAAPYIEQRANLASLFDRMYELRQRAARNAGFANFRDYIFPAKFRFDYTPSDCVRFHEAVEATVAPAVERMLAVRRRRLSLDAAPALGHGRGSVPQRAATALRRRPTSSSAGLAGSSSGSIPRSAASSRS